MKRNFPRMVIILILTHVVGNILVGLLYNKIDWPESKNTLYTFLQYSQYTAAAFMMLSILFFPKLWSYVVNIILLLPLSLTMILFTAIMGFVAGPFGLIVPLAGILDLFVFFNRNIRAYFGITVTAENE